MHISASDMSMRPESLLQALNGEYIQPEAGGDLLRDGAGVLPTGQLPDSMQRCTWLEGSPWCYQPQVSAFSALLALQFAHAFAEHFNPVPTPVNTVVLLQGPEQLKLAGMLGSQGCYACQALGLACAMPMPHV